MAEWTIDTAHTETAFSVKHMGLSNVKGSFQTTSGTVTTDDSGKIAAVNVTIDVASINTRIKDRDNHLKSADFFDAEKFPEIKFASTKVTATDEDTYQVEGTLTIKETSKTISFEAEVGTPIDDPYGLKRNAASLSFAIDRRDYGLVWSQSLANGNLVVGNKIKINADVEFTLNA
ncbi:YceI family protein [Sporolactobacillus sp. CPB3-1]|uniref:YceI family protein n=1 Tax=Sporolactobacillus mangiferae TaxID=2940498 RepID=A0ABT0MDC8_9BACL|nr:YceI family protein [Sporolactobacillus mangiferae]MCL1632320.1 YceI family protein [Sporolactobacillus mangiferae]